MPYRKTWLNISNRQNQFLPNTKVLDMKEYQIFDENLGHQIFGSSDRVHLSRISGDTRFIWQSNRQIVGLGLHSIIEEWFFIAVAFRLKQRPTSAKELKLMRIFVLRVCLKIAVCYPKINDVQYAWK